MDYQKLPDRNESRYKLGPERSQSVHALLGSFFTRIEHPDPVTVTAHLASPELSTPTSYLRLRNYVPALCAQVLTLDPDERWFFEHKSLSGVKARIRQSLSNILVGTSYPELSAFNSEFPDVNQVIQQFGRPLMPIIATESVRTHYRASGARMTVDEHMSYYPIAWGELHAQRVATKPTIKLELKVEQPDLSGSAIEQFHSVCEQLQAAPVADGEVAEDIRMIYQRFLETRA